jgi:DNA mismatch endonuclease (patch repair protein)
MRFRVDWPLPGLPRRRADIAFTRRGVAVFVDGCFWHACPEHRTAPASNADWWATKLENNVRRDRDTDEHLRAAGWTVLRFWEHENSVVAADSVEAVVRRVTGPGAVPTPARPEPAQVGEGGPERDGDGATRR